MAQNAAEPSMFGYESATESHRGFDDEPASTPSTARDEETPSTLQRSVAEEMPAADLTPDGASAPIYESAFGDYRLYRRSESPDWVGANDRVGKIGGWRTYAREQFEAAEAEKEPVSGDRASDVDTPIDSNTAEPERADAMPPTTGTDAKAAGARPVPVDPNAPDAPDAMDSADPVDAASADPARRNPLLAHDSVLDDYRTYEAAGGPNWIEANRRVGEIGGWRAYARELFEASDTESEVQ